ncbi:MAG: hypothetical protein HY740_03300 [Chloroflexi bacterium]|nr:hypothetical protein [Chloroflexota bacterium]
MKLYAILKTKESVEYSIVQMQVYESLDKGLHQIAIMCLLDVPTTQVSANSLSIEFYLNHRTVDKVTKLTSLPPDFPAYTYLPEYEISASQTQNDLIQLVRLDCPTSIYRKRLSFGFSCSLSNDVLTSEQKSNGEILSTQVYGIRLNGQTPFVKRSVSELYRSIDKIRYWGATELPMQHVSLLPGHKSVSSSRILIEIEKALDIVLSDKLKTGYWEETDIMLHKPFRSGFVAEKEESEQIPTVPELVVSFLSSRVGKDADQGKRRSIHLAQEDNYIEKEIDHLKTRLIEVSGLLERLQKNKVDLNVFTARIENIDAEISSVTHTLDRVAKKVERHDWAMKRNYVVGLREEMGSALNFREFLADLLLSLSKKIYLGRELSDDIPALQKVINKLQQGIEVDQKTLTILEAILDKREVVSFDALEERIFRIEEKIETAKHSLAGRFVFGG